MRGWRAWLYCLWVFVPVASLCLAQAPQTGRQFDVASVRLLPKDGPVLNKAEFSRAGFEADGALLKTLISRAFEISISQIEGSSEALNFKGLTPPPTYRMSAKATGPEPVSTLRRMLQTLLIERFQLKYHKETRTDEVFVLSVSKSGLKIKPAGDPDSAAGWVRFQERGAEATNASMDNLARFLEVCLAQIVVNQTGVGGRYSFTLRSGVEDAEHAYPFMSFGRGSEANLTYALRDVGLDLKRSKLPVEHLVVDSALVVPGEN